MIDIASGQADIPKGCVIKLSKVMSLPTTRRPGANKLEQTHHQRRKACRRWQSSCGDCRGAILHFCHDIASQNWGDSQKTL